MGQPERPIEPTFVLFGDSFLYRACTCINLECRESFCFHYDYVFKLLKVGGHPVTHLLLKCIAILYFMQNYHTLPPPPHLSGFLEGWGKDILFA